MVEYIKECIKDVMYVLCMNFDELILGTYIFQSCEL
jgi:type VI protein secretion system component VasF